MSTSPQLYFSMDEYTKMYNSFLGFLGKTDSEPISDPKQKDIVDFIMLFENAISSSSSPDETVQEFRLKLLK